MYSIDVYLMIVAIDGLLSFFAVFGKGEDYYKDLAALGFASFISVYLSIVSVSGTVTDSTGSLLQDDGLMWFWIMIAVIQAIFLLLEIVEAYQEHIDNGKIKENLIS